MKNYKISLKGRIIEKPVIEFGDTLIIIKGRFIKIAEIFDEYWIKKDSLPNPLTVIEKLQNSKHKPDIFTFTQRIPDTDHHFDFPFEWVNYAVIKLDTYDNWFQKKITSSTRRNIKASDKRGIIVKVSQFDEVYIQGIMAIYNETPIRQGRRFWHYGKSFEEVRAENSTYSDRSIFLAAYYQEEMIGYCKIVLDDKTAAIMQIISRMEFYDKRPNNALLAAAVEQCCLRGIQYLLYEKFVYGKKTQSSLTEFKHKNGFTKMDVPRYYIPITLKGKFATTVGFHKSPKYLIPQFLMSIFINFRIKWYKHKFRGN